MATTSNGRGKTRERILNAARDLLAEEGYAGFTLSEVERRVGLAIGTGSIHRHFASKEALLQAIVEEEVSVIRAIRAEANRAVQEVDDPIERSVRIYQQLLKDMGRFDRFFALMLDQGDRRPDLREAIRAAIQPPDTPATSEDRAVDALIWATLGGYHLFSTMQDRPFQGIDQHYFLRLLAVTARLAETVRLADITDPEEAAPTGKNA
jgi:AcrR family transcriptional regulator